MLAIIDYGVGNLTSVKNMLKKAGYKDVVIASGKEEIERANKLILPGVGHFDYAMKELRRSTFFDTLNETVLNKKIPILGICLGVQLLTKSSEEGSEPGLGWINAKTVKFREDQLDKNHKIPHMSWSDTTFNTQSKLFTGMYDNPRFYYVHSFHLECEHSEDILCRAQYGYDFIAGVERGNVLGVQFHPEKSHKFGMKFLQNFIEHY